MISPDYLQFLCTLPSLENLEVDLTTDPQVCSIACVSFEGCVANLAGLRTLQVTGSYCRFDLKPLQELAQLQELHLAGVTPSATSPPKCSPLPASITRLELELELNTKTEWADCLWPLLETFKGQLQHLDLG